jgi:pyruvate carboxylase
MLLRGRNTVGYTPYPTEVTEAFVAEAAASGIDIFRIFDALNDVDQMKPAIAAVLKTGTAVAEVALCYTADLLNPDEKLYTLDYYLNLAQEIVDAGAHIIAIKDMAGLLRPAAAAKLVKALRERFDLPVHLHTHDTAGGQLATLMAAIDAGVDAVDVASAPMGGTTSQPSASALIAALEHTPRDSGITLDAVTAMSLTGSRCDRFTRRSNRVCPARPVVFTSTRFRVVSSRTFASRQSPSAWVTSSKRSKTCTPRLTRFSAARPR